jgi:hypothetical protein
MDRKTLRLNTAIVARGDGSTLSRQITAVHVMRILRK